MTFEESAHPRDGDGKFTEKGGAVAAEKTADAVRKYSDDPARDLKEMGLPPHDLEKLMGEEFKGVKGQAAIEKLMAEKRGHVKAAFQRDDIGDIDLLWGNDSLGLQHIIKHREAEKAGHAEEVLTYLANAIEKSEFKKKNDRGNFEFAYSEAGYKFKVVIAPEYHGKRITYLLTAFRRDKK